ncbi:hypothetical protein [Chryseobacterium paridis]|uniref:Uncharacterized protein n=1 Tax=Chryseobacterium paridis TaxID=2800328 RepID=A0ABS1FTP0_9FLAO|nr:hypothetical protein [Chryseobacterium paridis]MBK1895795.1 hypothetical protein [Chryseobacterium paridis]
MKITIAKEIIKDNTQIVDSLINLSTEQYEELISNINSIYRFELIDNYFQILYGNYNDFIETINKNSLELLDNSKSPLILNRSYLNRFKIESNRKFINYLSSFRTLVDHVPRMLNIKEKEDFKGYLNFLYDKEFSYRFIYKLRNYTQHCGLPITQYESNFNSSLVKIFLMMNVDFLLNNYDSWGEVVKNDLKKYRCIDSKTIIDEHFSLVRKIYDKTLILLKDETLTKIDLIEKTIEGYKGNHKLLVLLEEDNGDLNSITYIPLDEIKKLKRIYLG